MEQEEKDCAFDAEGEQERVGRRERWDQPDIEIKIRKWLSLQPAGRVLCENTSYRGRGIVCVC